jgi:hypothetical protein
MRQEFVELYPTVDSPATYVNKLYLHALRRSATGEEMEQGINEFGTSLSATDSGARGRVLLRLTQSTDARDEFNRAFVQMQYVGYLRRNPNEFPDFTFAGSDFWLEKLNSFNGNFIEAEMGTRFSHRRSIDRASDREATISDLGSQISDLRSQISDLRL